MQNLPQLFAKHAAYLFVFGKSCKRAKVSRFTHRMSSFLSPLKAFFSLIKIYVSHKKNIKDITKRITKKIEQEDHLFRDIFSPLA